MTNKYKNKQVFCKGAAAEAYMQHHSSILRSTQQLISLCVVEYYSVDWPLVFSEDAVCNITHWIPHG